MATKKEKVKHLQWAVESRARNQRCAVRLLGIFLEYEDEWKTQRWARAAQDLLSVSFSLWRAAFLADKTAHRTAVFSDGVEFLERVIEDNAISYPQDRRCKEWTFNYYIRNARAALEVLAKHWPDQVPQYESAKLSPTNRWEYYQGVLDEAVARFETAVRDKRSRVAEQRTARETRLVAKALRRKSREVTLALRKSSKQE